MARRLNRRQILGASTAVAGGMVVGRHVRAQDRPPAGAAGKSPKYKLGLVTYNIAARWSLPTLLDVCRKVGLDAVEFRTTHQHGVEPSLSKADRAEVRKRCADAGVTLWGLGTTCEFHAPDAAVVARNIETCRQFIGLAQDLGAKGVKVRPNGLPKEAPVAKTLEQIGQAVRTCAQAAADAGVEVWVEVHGSGTQDPPNMRRIMDVADHPAAGVTWNSNGTDVKGGSVRASFEILRPKIYSCHINELTSGYPWRELFALLTDSGYDRYTLIEIGGLECDKLNDAIRFLQFYKSLWRELSRTGSS